jgi:hypothetical protein
MTDSPDPRTPCSAVLVDDTGFEYLCSRPEHDDKSAHASTFRFDGRAGADETPRFALLHWSPNAMAIPFGDWDARSAPTPESERSRDR